MRFIAGLTLLLLLSPLALAAQSFRLIHWGVEDGLPSSEVYSLLQDQKGYLWFGTDRGAARFDGERFELLGRKDGLFDETVFKLYEDAAGRIWFGTFSPSLSYWENGTIRPYRYNGLLESTLPGNGVKSSIYASEWGDVYLGGYQQGLVHIDALGKMTWTIEHRRGTCRMIDGRPFFYGDNYDSPLSDLKNATGIRIQFRGQNFDFSPQSKSDFFSIGVEMVSEEAMCLGFGKRFFLIQGGQILWEKHFDRDILSVMVDAEGNMWIGMRDGGVVVLDGNGNLRHWQFPQLLAESVSAMLQDREGGFWFTTAKGGVFYLPSLNFPYFPQQGKSEEEAIAGIALANDSLLYVAGDVGRISSLQPRATGAWEMKEEMQLPMAAALLWDGSALWMASSSLYRLQDGRLEVMIAHMKGRTKDIAMNHKWGLAIGMNYGLRIVNLESDTNYRASSTRVHSLYSDSRDRLYVADLEGLKMLGDKGLEFVPRIGSLLTSRVTAIRELKDGRMAFGTAGDGIFIYGGDENEHYREADGLKSDVVNCLAVDLDGILWAGGNRGLQRLDLSKKGKAEIRGFDVQHGMPFMEIKFIETGGDFIWISSSNSISRLDRQHLPSASKAPDVFFTGLKINGLKADLKDSLALSHRENFLQFDFKGLHFRSGGPLRYRYRMAGLEEEWRFTNDQRVTYSALLPGAYTFEVSACNEDGDWSPARQMAIVIHQPYWTEWWFLTLVLLSSLLIAGGGGAYFFWQWRQRLNRQQALEEWKLKALRARINPHFTFNTFNTIQAFIHTRDTASAELYLHKFARLIRLVMQQSDEIWVSLGADLEMLRLYLDLNKMRFEEEFEYEYELPGDLVQETTWIPAMVVQPFVENAVLHGLLPKEGKGKLQLRFKMEGDLLRCTIEDDGIGRAAAAARKAKRKGEHESVGMGLVAARLDLLGKKAGEWVQVEDLYDGEGKATGTRVNLFLAIKTKL